MLYSIMAPASIPVTSRVPMLLMRSPSIPRSLRRATRTVPKMGVLTLGFVFGAGVLLFGSVADSSVVVWPDMPAANAPAESIPPSRVSGDNASAEEALSADQSSPSPLAMVSVWLLIRLAEAVSLASGVPSVLKVASLPSAKKSSSSAIFLPSSSISSVLPFLISFRA